MSAVMAIALSASLLALLAGSATPQSGGSEGARIFRQRCAVCHGAHGQGTASGPRLTGTRSVADLARFIAASMPPGAGTRLHPAEARAVAAYIHSAFYGVRPQADASPVRPELLHLTVRQYRNSLADLIGSFRGASPPDARHGLHGEYYRTGQLRPQDRVLERTDPQVQFDFGASGPGKEQPDPYQFAMRWTGSVIAPDTGDYDFVVRTEHAARLWVNDPTRPVVDAWVKSGNDTEFRGTVFLLGGRAYPLRLEFSKGVQGVDDLSKVRQKPPARASIALLWRPPHRGLALIPERNLAVSSGAPVYVAATPFPPDDRSMGFERGTFVSRDWDAATAAAAIETAGYVSDHLSELSGAPDGATDRTAKLQEFCRRFAERAFRRPLTKDVQELYVDRQFARAPNPDASVRRVVLLVLQSPRFLYPDLTTQAPDDYSAASRLALALWDSLPDGELVQAASAGQLRTRQQVAQQAQRMVADPRAWSKLRDFLLEWLKVDRYPDLAKDPKLYPAFDAAAAADLRESFELFLERVAWGEKSDYRDLLLSDGLYLNGRLAKVYGCGLPADAPFQWVTQGAGERCGVLTQPYMLAAFAHYDVTSPIHRGVLVVRSLLGRVLKPPPAAFAPIPASLHPDMTTRQRVELQTKPAMCTACHGMINPLGFTLEEYDAIGRVRTQENGQAIDDVGGCRSADGKVVKLNGARDLAVFLAGSDEAHTAFVQKLFQYATKQPVQAFGKGSLQALVRYFSANGFSIRRQLVETATVASLRH